LRAIETSLRNTSGSTTAEPMFAQTPPSRSQATAAMIRKSRWEAAPSSAGGTHGCMWIVSVPSATCTAHGIPAREQAARVVSECLKRGLIVLTAGTYGNVVRLLVPLVITDDEFAEGVRILEESMTAVHAH